MAIFTEEIAPAASWLAATGLVKSWVVIFTEKKAPAASFLAATGLVRSRPKPGPAQKHKILLELGPESTVWAENLSKWIG